ncbi:MAG: hypothetical protein ABIH52_03845 [Candidatus Aenigmatarchaeota archaeon]|nr:hypothetical protein [Nanoarchaeota archaeon]
MKKYQRECNNTFDGEMVEISVVPVELDIRHGIYNKMSCPHYAGIGLCSAGSEIGHCRFSKMTEDELK